jgi:hypothetical protein
MDKLKSTIAEWIVTHCRMTCGRAMNVELKTANGEAESMLALPSGLVAIKKCPWSPHGNIPADSCIECNGRGTITRQLTIKEAVT